MSGASIIFELATNHKDHFIALAKYLNDTMVNEIGAEIEEDTFDQYSRDLLEFIAKHFHMPEQEENVKQEEQQE